MGYKGYIVMSQGWGGSFVGRTVVLRRRIGALISFFISHYIIQMPATRGARNPNLQVVLRMRRIYLASIRLTSFKNEWNAQKTI